MNAFKINAFKVITTARYACLVFLICLLSGNYDAHGLELIGFGDSITKGSPYVSGRDGDGRRVGGYEPELEKLIRTETSRKTIVYNWGVGGENTSEGLSRIRDVLKTHRNADGILILEGTNDGLFSVDTTIHHLESMIRAAKRRKIQPFIATLTPDTRDGHSEKNSRIRKEYNPKIRSLARRTGAILADQHAGMAGNWESFSHDRLHPNRRGYREMAKIWSESARVNTPEARTSPVSMVSENDAVLEGLINPKKSATEYYFEYGNTLDYGGRTATMNAGSGNTAIGVSASVSGLSDNSDYHYRLVAKNDWGKSVAKDIAFHTLESSSSSCFIATAAFGSPLSSQVSVLRAFRDQYLNQSQLGRKLVQLYYRLSPPLADWISKNHFYRKLIRILLYPLIAISSIALGNQIPGIVLTITFFGFLLPATFIVYKLIGSKFRVQDSKVSNREP